MPALFLFFIIMLLLLTCQYMIHYDTSVFEAQSTNIVQFQCVIGPIIRILFENHIILCAYDTIQFYRNVI